MKNEENVIEHSKFNMVSYGFARAARQFVVMAFVAFGFYFYEAEVGLNVWLTSLGFIIYAIWNAVNDPFVGYITNKEFKFSKKWGRFFPWTIIGGVPWIISYILIFTPPNVDPESGAWIIFGWLVFSTCLFDTFASIYDVNFYAIFPSKFRTARERRIASGISVPLGVLGITLGGILPPLFVTYGVPQTYVIQGVVVILTGLFLLCFAIPGLRDDQVMIDRYFIKQSEKIEGESFIKSLRTALRQKLFIAFLLMYTLFISLTLCVQASVPYIVRFILKMPASAQIYLQLAFLVGALVSIPLWIKLAHRTNNNKQILLIAGVILTISTLPFTFIGTLYGLIVVLIFWGVGLGGYWVMLPPVMGDVIDESTVRNKKHEEGLYYGIRQFFARLAIIIQAITFAIIHTLTGFEAGATTQSASAIWGIHIQFGLAPMIFMLIGIIIFWKWYNLTPDKIEINKAKLKELGL